MRPSQRSGGVPGPVATGFYAAAADAERQLLRDGQDALIDGRPSALERAALQRGFERLNQELKAHVGVRRRYFESADRLVENLRS